MSSSSVAKAEVINNIPKTIVINFMKKYYFFPLKNQEESIIIKYINKQKREEPFLYIKFINNL